MSSTPERYVPAAGRAWLTTSYDRVVTLTMRERAWRPALVHAIAHDLPPAGTVVEVGCGTGSLTVALASARPDATVFGVDGDDAVLALARRKRGAERVTWLNGLAQSFQLPVASADVALCSLLLHHLADDTKHAALQHIANILTNDGALHIADWGPPRGPATALGARCSSSTVVPDRRACSTGNYHRCSPRPASRPPTGRRRYGRCGARSTLARPPKSVAEIAHLAPDRAQVTHLT